MTCGTRTRTCKLVIEGKDRNKDLRSEDKDKDLRYKDKYKDL